MNLKNDFSRDEQLAFIKALDGMLQADGKIQGNETLYLSAALKEMERGTSQDTSFIEESRGLDIEEFKKILIGMEDKKKDFFKKSIAAMAIVDGQVDLTEKRLFEVLDSYLS